MDASRHLLSAAAIVVAIFHLATSQAAEDLRTGQGFIGPEAPKAATEESPFGGPPPMKRGKRNSMNCKAEQQACTIKPSQPVGTPCSCPLQGGGIIKGVVVE
jgi:hypothetical protein